MFTSQQHRTVHAPPRSLWKALRWEPSGSTQDFVSPETKHVVSNEEFLRCLLCNHKVNYEAKRASHRKQPPSLRVCQTQTLPFLGDAPSGEESDFTTSMPLVQQDNVKQLANTGV